MLTGQSNLAVVGSLYFTSAVENYIYQVWAEWGSLLEILIFYLTCLLLLYTTRIINTAISCCYCWLHPYRLSYSLLLGRGNIAQEITAADILMRISYGSFGHGKSWPGVRSPRTGHRTMHESLVMVWVVGLTYTLERECCLYATYRFSSIKKKFFYASLDWDTE